MDTFLIIDSTILVFLIVRFFPDMIMAGQWHYLVPSWILVCIYDIWSSPPELGMAHAVQGGLAMLLWVPATSLIMACVHDRVEY